MFNGTVIKKAVNIEFLDGFISKIALQINTTIPQLI